MLKFLSILTSFFTLLHADFLQVNVQPAPLLEWNQVPTTYYTGQRINISWSEDGSIAPVPLIKATYVGAGGTRTLTPTSGINITDRTFAMRLSDSTNGLATNVPITLSGLTNTSLTMNSQESITILQSKIQNIAVYDGTRLMVTGQSAVCDDRLFTVQWRGLGQAQFGNATLTMNSNGGGGGQFGTSLTGIPVTSANMTTNFTCVRTLVPSFFRTYSFTISVAELGQNAYTGTSSSFSLTQAPSPSNTPSVTPTSSRTPSSSPSVTPTISNTPSPSQTPTPSNTPTPSPSSSKTPTPSTTETARPSVDYAGIAAAAAAAANAQTGVIAGGVVGGLVLVFMILSAWKVYSYEQLKKKRLHKQKMSARYVQEVNTLYNLSNEPTLDKSIVMYKLNAPLPKSKKGFTPSQV